MSDNKDKCTIILLQFWGWENISHWNYFLTELPYFLNYLIPNINSACAFHMTVFYAIFWIVQLWRINWSFVISWKKKRKKVLVSPKPLFFPRKILMLQQKYLKTIVKSPRWNLKHVGNCAVLMSQCHSQFRKKVWIGFVQLHDVVRIWNLY